MTPLQQIQFDQAIGQELLALLPPTFRGLRCVAQLAEGSAGRWSLRIQLTPEPDAPGVALVSDALEQRLAAMFAAHRRDGTGVVEARYIVDASRPDAPSVVGELEYEDDAP